MKRLSIYAQAVLAMLVATGVPASYISMATGFSVADGSDGVTLRVTTTNRGDEPAYGIRFDVQVGTRAFTSSAVPQLAVDESASADFPVREAFQLPGRYPVVVRTHYQDVNTYPFTALHVGFHDFQHPAVSKVMIQAEDASIPVDGAGQVQYTLRNDDTAEHTLALTLHLPDELAALKVSENLTLGPGQSRTVPYTLENFSALENSSYAVALVAEYEDGESHYSTAGTGMVRVAAPENPAGVLPWVAGGLAAVALAIPVIIRLRRA